MSIAPETELEGRIPTLVGKLHDAIESLDSAPTIELARDVCKKSRLLYSAFEEEAIWNKSIDDLNRKETLSTLERSLETLNNYSSILCQVDPTKFMKILVAIGERVVLTKHSTFETIRVRLDAYAAEMVG